MEQVPDKWHYLEAGALLPHCKEKKKELGIKYELAFQQGMKRDENNAYMNLAEVVKWSNWNIHIVNKLK